MPDFFGTCLAFTLGEEGGFVDDPRDPGGATNRGVTLASWRQWTREPGLGVAALRALSAADVQPFYSARYYNAMRCDRLAPAIALMVFDHGVNAGDRCSGEVLQRALGLSGRDVDGNVGPQTLGAAEAVDPAAFLQVLHDAQVTDYRGKSDFASFGRGWLNRAAARRDAASALLIQEQDTVIMADIASHFSKWVRQPTTVAGIAAALGTASAFATGSLTWESAVPLLVGAVVGMVLPDGSGVQVSIEKVVADAIQAAELVVRSEAPVVVSPVPASAETPAAKIVL